VPVPVTRRKVIKFLLDELDVPFGSRTRPQFFYVRRARRRAARGGAGAGGGPGPGRARARAILFFAGAARGRWPDFSKFGDYIV